MALLLIFISCKDLPMRSYWSKEYLEAKGRNWCTVFRGHRISLLDCENIAFREVHPRYGMIKNKKFLTTKDIQR